MTTHKQVRSTEEALKLALEAAYLAGFNASGEGYNGEYPFGDKMQDPAENRVWKKDRDNYIKKVLAQPAVAEQHKQSTTCVEPIGKTYLCNRCHTPFDGEFQCPSCGHGRATKKSVYTTPPYVATPRQRPSRSDMTWVGLTYFERVSVIEEDRNRSLLEHCERIEAKLKEKNV